ncbi:hypothetical protein CEP51_014051 [Fusarium floridanum]|uniref:Uncharacterized protein n=1 Tax=Fusarium floridanum TaxID=1325733 RepID=A0A428Q021_9HYPO|nr:hypothetical protein CEP51_014051 [Fusarium floridanum]
MNEKMLLTDLLLHFTSMRKHMAHEFAHSGTELYDQFLREAFKNWSSNERSNPAPVWRDVKFTETSIQVGVLRDHHPEPGSGGVIPQLPLPSARAAGAPAMLSLTLNLDEESYAFLWRDTNCKFINPKYVKLDDGCNMARARVAAIEHYDGQTRERIVSFNTKLVISAGRRRIRKWAVRGSQTRAGLGPRGGPYAFLWRDTNYKFINPKYIRLDDGYNTATARAAAAVEHHDSQRRERIVSSNIKLIVSAA